MNTIIIRKVKEPFGWLGNMSQFPVIYNGKDFFHTEGLFQTLRFLDEEIIEAIRAQRNPMKAKITAKSYQDKIVIQPMSEPDVENMRLCLDLKLNQNQELIQQLIDTKDAFIVEDCTNRQHGSGLFWGAALKEGQWVGKNILGKLWMEKRKELCQ